MTRVAIDTNILAYLAGVAHVEADDAKVERARALIEDMSAATLVAPVQALGELLVVLRRAGLPAEKARETIADLIETFETPASEPRTALGALDLAVDHKLQFWDALIFTAAADAGCTLLLSEDMQHGFVSRGMTVLNPFAEPTHPKLAALLADD
ncbi:MAG TPA: PIN domain-containing protein [Croceibacterium sp.]|jgi:predicted nucleic acid-binding protein